MRNLKEIQKFIKEAVEGLKVSDIGCYTLKLEGNLAICVGWSDGYDEEDETVIHSTSEPTYAINVGIKVWTSDAYMLTDFDMINSPYYENGDVIDTLSVNIEDAEDDYEWLATHLLNEYDKLRDLDIDDDGKIVESPVDEENDVVDDIF